MIELDEATTVFFTTDKGTSILDLTGKRESHFITDPEEEDLFWVSLGYPPVGRSLGSKKPS